MPFSEIVAKDKQGDSGLQVVPLAAESVRQARQSACAHSYRKVDPFNMASANQIMIRIADPRFVDHALQFGRGVARWPFNYPSVNLDQLAIVHSRSETQANSVGISGHSVCGQLELPKRGLVQLFDEYLRVLAGPSAKVPSENEFTASIQCQERPAIALALVVRIPFIPFFAIGVAPKLVEARNCRVRARIRGRIGRKCHDGGRPCLRTPTAQICSQQRFGTSRPTSRMRPAQRA